MSVHDAAWCVHGSGSLTSDVTVSANDDLRSFNSWSPVAHRDRGGVVVVSAVVGRQRVRRERIVDRVVPAIEVDVVVIAADVAYWVWTTSEGVVFRHVPAEGGQHGVGVESQVLSGAVVAHAVVEPDAAQVDGHVDFVSSVGVEAVEPHFIVFGVDFFGPDFGDDDVGLNLVGVAAIDHELWLVVEVGHSAADLAIGEKPY